MLLRYHVMFICYSTLKLFSNITSFWLKLYDHFLQCDAYTDIMYVYNIILLLSAIVLLCNKTVELDSPV